MSQDAGVMAFRKRLKKRGYTDISIVLKRDQSKICRDSAGFKIYIVTCAEPLTRAKVSGEFSAAILTVLMR